MKKKKETKQKKFTLTLQEGEKVLAIGDKVLFIGKSLFDRTEVVQVETNVEFPYAMLKNGIRIKATYMKKDKLLSVISREPRDKAYVWGKKATEIWEDYQLSVKLNLIKEKLNKVEFNALDKSKLREVLPLLEELLTPKE